MSPHSPLKARYSIDYDLSLTLLVLTFGGPVLTIRILFLGPTEGNGKEHGAVNAEYLADDTYCTQSVSCS